MRRLVCNLLEGGESLFFFWNYCALLVLERERERVFVGANICTGMRTRRSSRPWRLSGRRLGCHLLNIFEALNVDTSDRVCALYAALATLHRLQVARRCGMWKGANHPRQVATFEFCDSLV
jgi:hypothetical protein